MSTPEFERQERIREQRRASLVIGRQRKAELIAAGDERAKGGYPARKFADADKRLEELAEEEIRRQMQHRDPKVRRDAARLALELKLGRFKAEGEGIRQVIYETRALMPDSYEPPPPPPL